MSGARIGAGERGVAMLTEIDDAAEALLRAQREVME
jgi:hypothetical protein